MQLKKKFELKVIRYNLGVPCGYWTKRFDKCPSESEILEFMESILDNYPNTAYDMSAKVEVVYWLDYEFPKKKQDGRK